MLNITPLRGTLAEPTKRSESCETACRMAEVGRGVDYSNVHFFFFISTKKLKPLSLPLSSAFARIQTHTLRPSSAVRFVSL